MATMELFTCEGALSATDERLRFVLRAHPDTSLSVAVERIGNDAAGTGTAADASEAQAQETSDGALLGEVEAERQQHSSGAHEPQAHHAQIAHAASELREGDPGYTEQHRDDELDDDGDTDEGEGMDTGDMDDDDNQEDADDYEYVAFDGSCTKQFDPEQNNEYFYAVHFKLVRWSQHDFSSSAIYCVGHLSAREGLRGEYVSLGVTDQSSRHEFHIPLAAAADSAASELDDAESASTLTPSPHRIETLSDQLYPLTPGIYELSGYTIAENGYVYRCIVRLTLHASGELTGSSQELLFPQVCEIVGSWSRLELSYTMRYTMSDRVCAYIYHCSPFLGSMRGWWQNVDIDAQSHNSERGCLEFSLTRSRRHWSEKVHSQYPLAFRRCITSLLLVSLRGECAPGGPRYTLPSPLWSQVFAFCDFHWFRDDDDDAAAVDTESLTTGADCKMSGMIW